MITNWALHHPRAVNGDGCSRGARQYRTQPTSSEFSLVSNFHSITLDQPGGAVVPVTGRGGVCAWGNNPHGLSGIEPRGGQTGRPSRSKD